MSRKPSGKPTGLTRRSLLGGAALGASALRSGKEAAAAQDHDGILDVAIVGAGLSGLVTARELAKRGVDSFVVLEARDRVGGRTLNQKVGGGYVVEAGGQWVGPTQTAVLELAAELGIGTFPTYDEGAVVYLIGGERTRVDPGATLTGASTIADPIDELARSVPLDRPWEAEQAAEWDAMTFAEWLDTQNVGPEERFGVAIGASLTFGALPEQLSLLWVLFYVHSAGGWRVLESIEGGAQQDRIEGGSQILGSKIAEALGDRVRLSAPVTAIRGWDRQGEPVEVATPSGVVRARRAVVAMTPSLAERIVFEPALPAVRDSLQRGWPSYGTGMKAHLIYREPFWRQAGLNGQSFADAGPVLWTTDNSPPDGGIGAIMGFLDTARLPTEPAARRRAFAEELAQRFGPRALDYTAYREMDWAQERYTKGCVSPLAPGFLTAYGAALRPPVGNLVWGGTETAEVWNGYMDGAVRAGRRVAERLAALDA